MEIRLNKFISESGFCSRREADKYIETGHVTVNGKKPKVGLKVSLNDTVMIDDTIIQLTEQQKQNIFQSPRNSSLHKTDNNKIKSSPGLSKISEKEKQDNALTKPKYGKYNKYAAARKTTKIREANGDTRTPQQLKADELLRKVMIPKFGKSLSRGAVAQRLAAAPKSAALRKTSKNNPLNKTKRMTQRGSGKN